MKSIKKGFTILLSSNPTWAPLNVIAPNCQFIFSHKILMCSLLNGLEFYMVFYNICVEL